ncbi:MAG: hypothetical protein M0R46_12490 [Candidatus Muirbacterium halophilum]|nr:hypothetical protein [Candidatus Muirbacterium halophilum]MCK9476735.1 hypothetical protein [Candidatus Muirbacterium halophilum]
MRIDNSQLSYNSDRFYAEHSERKERTIRIKGNTTTIEENEYYKDGKSKSVFSDNYDDITLSNSSMAQKIESKEQKKSFSISYTEKDKQKIQLVEEMVRMLTGKKDFKIKLMDFDKSKEDSQINEELQDRVNEFFNSKAKLKITKKSENTEISKKNETPKTDNIEEAGENEFIDQTIYEAHYEHERLDIKTTGKVILENGKELTIDLNIHMSRDFAMEKFTHLQSGKQVDPLVINYDGKGVFLEDEKFEFDLDFDGKTENISTIKEGSGFLALDKNEDGIINDGNELFGTKTGNGFKELSKHDIDQNGWIDENDEIFNKLKIWETTPTGETRLFTLSEKGIGAIFLGKTDTLFNFKSTETNEENGIMKSSSIFLKEDGNAGYIHQIDFIV